MSLSREDEKISRPKSHSLGYVSYFCEVVVTTSALFLLAARSTLGSDRRRFWELLSSPSVEVDLCLLDIWIAVEHSRIEAIEVISCDVCDTIILIWVSWR